VLDTAGARDADMVIAATFSDEVNMVTCQVAHSVFSVPRKIARLRSQSYLDAIYSDLYRRDHLPIDVVISPEKEVAEAALRRIASPSTFDNETFLSDDAQMLGIALGPDCPVLNTPLKQLSELFSTLAPSSSGCGGRARCSCRRRAISCSTGDQIYVFTHTLDVDRTLEIFGKTAKTPERVIVIGGGNVGLSVARTLENSSSASDPA
jgi:trk system potassium uptake protein TrkA